MSASSKKKLRKEQNATIMTERQQREQAEAKKLKITSLIFTAGIALVVCSFIVLAIVQGIANLGLVGKFTTVGTVGEHKISLTDFNYYYFNTVQNTRSEWQSTGEQLAEYTGTTVEEALLESFGLDLSKPLSELIYDEESNQTWADFFIEQSMQQAQREYALYDAAMAAGYTMSQEDQEYIDNMMANLEMMAQVNRISTKNYLRMQFGDYADAKSFEEYLTRSLIAEGYYAQYNDALEFTDDELAAYEGENSVNYNSYSYTYYTLQVSDYLALNRKEQNAQNAPAEDAEESETPDNDEVDSYTDEEREAARADAEAAATELAALATLEELNEAIKALPQNQGKTSAAATESKAVLYTNTIVAFREWLTEEGRQIGDTTVLPITNQETEAVTGYYAVMFNGVTDNTEPMSNVRHILISPEEGEDEEANDAAAKEKAEKLLQQWKDGKADEDSFAALVHDNTDDEGSKETGGLYENIHAGSSYVPEFLAWATDPARQEKDCEIVKTSYGYHIMFFVGKSETSYRTQMLTDGLRTETMTEWYEQITADYTITIDNTKKVMTDWVLSPA